LLHLLVDNLQVNGQNIPQSAALFFPIEICGRLVDDFVDEEFESEIEED
jgi:hypothetical protein